MKAIKKVIFKAQNTGDSVKVNTSCVMKSLVLNDFRLQFHIPQFLTLNGRLQWTSVKQLRSKSWTRRIISLLILTFSLTFVIYLELSTRFVMLSALIKLPATFQRILLPWQYLTVLFLARLRRQTAPCVLYPSLPSRRLRQASDCRQYFAPSQILLQTPSQLLTAQAHHLQNCKMMTTHMYHASQILPHSFQ